MLKIGKKFLVLVVLGLILSFPVFAQTAVRNLQKENLQKMYMNYLRQQGFHPFLDDAGDVYFTVGKDVFYIIVNENDQKYFHMYMGLRLGHTPLHNALIAANYTNSRSKVAKVYISQDGRSASINIELLVNKPRDFRRFFTRSISLIKNAEANFLSELRHTM